MNKDVLLVLLIVATVIVVVFLILRTIWRTALNATADTTRVQMEALLTARSDFLSTHTIFSKTSSSLIAVDETKSQVTQYFLDGNQIMVRTIQIHSIIDLQLLVDEYTSITGIGSAIGTDTSAIGIGKSFAQTNVQSIALRFLLDNTATPVVVHQFLSSATHGKFESASGYVRDAMNEATRIKAVLDVLIHRAQVAA